MASVNSGSFNTTAYSGRYLTFSWTLRSQSTDSNQSVINWELRSAGGDTQYYMTAPVRVTIDGQSVYSTSTRFQLYRDQLVASGTATIKHDTKGKKNFSASVEAAIYSTQINCRGSSSWDLPDIAQATIPELPASGTTGEEITINLPRSSGSFTHTVTWKFYESEGTIGTGLGTSVKWTIPRALANQIPNATKGTCTITCKTYNGSTLIGTESDTFTLNVNALDVPTVDSVDLTELTEGLATKFGGYVQSKSVISVTVNVTGAYSSTIKSYSTQITGTNIDLTYSGKTFDYAPSESGQLTIKTTVTDSRGRTGTLTKTINVLEYFAPMIYPLSATRCNEEGTEDANGEHLKVTLNFNIAPVGQKNDNSYLLEYKVSGTEDWQTLESGNAYYLEEEYVSTEAIVSETVAYNVRLTITDAFSSPKIYDTIPTVYRLINFGADGRSMAFGGVATDENTVAFKMATKFEEPASMADVKASKLTFDVQDAGSDLNDMKSSGFFYVAGASANRPLSGSGWLIVLSRVAGNCYQQFIANTGARYHRFFSSNQWTQWTSI